VSPSIRQYAFLLDKSMVEAGVTIDGERIDLPRETPPSPAAPVRQPARAAQTPTTRAEDTVEVPLIRLAWARSGDKGDTSNIGVIARKPELLPLLRVQLTEESVAAYLAHVVKGKVTRFDLPGIHALNFVCEQALGGGGMASLRNDALGKGMAQVLLAMPVRVPARLVLSTF
jgi:hypothetical protein